MVGVQGIPGAAVVGVARAVVLEDVVRGVVQAAEAQRRPALVTFGGVVEHDVEDDLDARPVQRLDHVAELVHRAERIPARAVRLVRREERDRRVAPVVDLARRAVLGIELEHRQQLHRGDPELLEIRDLLDQAGEGAAGLLADAGAGMAGEAAHVHLVHDGLRGLAGAAARRLPSRRRTDRPPRSSSRSRCCRRARRRRRDGSHRERPRRGHRGRGGPWRDRSACRSRDPTAPRRDSRRSGLPSRRGRTRASSGRCDWRRGRCGSPARPARRRRDRTAAARSPVACFENDAEVRPSRPGVAPSGELVPCRVRLWDASDRIGICSASSIVVMARSAARIRRNRRPAPSSVPAPGPIARDTPG